MQFDQVFQAVIAIVVGIGVLALYFWGTNWLLEILVQDRVGPKGEALESREKLRESIRPWLFIAPAVILLTVYLLYPAVLTLWLSFGDQNGNVRYTRPIYPEEIQGLNINPITEVSPQRMLDARDIIVEDYPNVADLTLEDFEGLNTNGDGLAFLFREAGAEVEQEVIFFRNYEWAFSSDQFWESVRNNIFWLLVPFLSTVFGLLIAVLADNVRWGSIIKSLIFLPMAISFVGASVIWRFVYDFRGVGETQIGLLNATVQAFGFEAQPWLNVEPWNNLFLMVILIWIQTGFAMVLLGAALRGVPEETLEAARIDGANEIQLFFQITIPQIMSTILVVLTTITIVVLKVFDIVLTMTNGQAGTQVLANLMYDQTFRARDFGHGSVVSIMIMVAVVPILVWNIRQFQQQEEIR